MTERILEISKKLHLSHIGSCLSAAGIIDDIFKVKKHDEKFVLSSGHAGLALYVAIEKYYGINAEDIYKHHGTHPDRCAKCHLDCSTGSLGHGLPVALGMAMSNRKKNVYCLLSDGECTEGTIWEVSNVIRKYGIDNLKIYLNNNGWGAYDAIDPEMIANVKMILPDIQVYTSKPEDYGLKGLSAHYVKL